MLICNVHVSKMELEIPCFLDLETACWPIENNACSMSRMQCPSQAAIAHGSCNPETLSQSRRLARSYEEFEPNTTGMIEAHEAI